MFSHMSLRNLCLCQRYRPTCVLAFLSLLQIIILVFFCLRCLKLELLELLLRWTELWKAGGKLLPSVSSACFSPPVYEVIAVFVISFAFAVFSSFHKQKRERAHGSIWSCCGMPFGPLNASQLRAAICATLCHRGLALGLHQHHSLSFICPSILWDEKSALKGPFHWPPCPSYIKPDDVIPDVWTILPFLCECSSSPQGQMMKRGCKWCGSIRAETDRQRNAWVSDLWCVGSPPDLQISTCGCRGSHSV